MKLSAAYSSPIARASALRFFAMILGVIAGVLVARLGGPEVKGVSAAFVAATSLFSVVVGFDLGHQVLRAARASTDLGHVPTLLGRLLAVYVVLAAGAAIVVSAFALTAVPLIIGTALVALGAHYAVATTGVRGPIVASIGAVIQQGTSAFGALFLGLAGALSEQSVIYLVMASAGIPLLYYVFSIRRVSESRPDASARALLRLAKQGFLWQLARLPQMLLLRLDVIVVFVALGAAAAGTYSVGLALAMLAILVPTQFAARTLHRLSSGLVIDLRAESLKSAIAGLGAAVLFAALGWPAITLLYGPEFGDAYFVLLACLPGAVAYGVVQVQTNYIRVNGTGQRLLWVNAVGLVVMCVGLVPLVPLFAQVGAAVAFSLGVMSVVVVTAVTGGGDARNVKEANGDDR